MFTGIVETIGTVVDVAPGPAGARIAIAHDFDGGLRVGDSVSVSGCCVTVTELGERRFTADLMGETLRRTALGGLTAGDPVNLERALAADGRFGGHVVQGHVDGVGTVTECTPHDAWTVMAVAVPEHLSPYLVEKGSVTVEGVSLTVASLEPGRFCVALIPHTLESTTFGTKVPGDPVNIEVDVLAKYVERLLGLAPAQEPRR